MAYYHPIVRYISFYVKSEADVEELVSDVFLAVWENRKELPVISHFNSYIYKIAKYKALN
ncbi:RNA polymerase sigma-70 factor, ECF subfamily [Porphyromonadaceae bacterium NLAE-zl-C104]|nr:RNA polymerase sigma-70 factor, ECF subfamily [Porphyromonadaceae bacterium KH3R12]SFS29872.1 RNA polymerase sigma-70 factor, ECF subfamily [Porphyromonadaceae bacterium NLAE-zl-C104]